MNSTMRLGMDEREETPPAVKVARLLRSAGWRIHRTRGACVLRYDLPGGGPYTTFRVEPAVYEAMCELEKPPAPTVEQLQDDLRHQRADYEAKVEKLRAEVAQFREAYEIAAEDRDACVANSRVLAGKLEAAERDVERLQQRIQMLEELLENSDAAFAWQRDRAEDAESQVERLREHIEQLEQQRGEPVGWVVGEWFRDVRWQWSVVTPRGPEPQSGAASVFEKREHAEARARKCGGKVLAIYGPPEPAEQEQPQDTRECAPACADCPIGGRDGDGPVCPNVDQCDQDCMELVRVGREVMGRKPGEACCDFWAAATTQEQQPADDPATAEARLLQEDADETVARLLRQAASAQLEARKLAERDTVVGCDEATGPDCTSVRVGDWHILLPADGSEPRVERLKPLAERDTDPELPSLPEARAGDDAGDEDDYDGKVL